MDTRVALVNIYAPNDVNQQVSFFKELQEQLQEFAEENIIIGGNFNCTLSEKDKKGGYPSNRKHAVVKEIKQPCNLYDLNDICRSLNPSEVLKHWQSTKQAVQKDTSPHNEIIWNNHNIKIDGKAPFYKNWFEKNIMRIEDLLHNDGNFLSFNQLCGSRKYPYPHHGGNWKFRGGGGGGQKPRKIQRRGGLNG